MKKKNVIVVVVAILAVSSLIIFDYTNLFSLLGFNMSNINFDLTVGFFNAIIVITLYIITYNTIDEKAVAREKNKREISVLLMRECYHECKWYVDNALSQEIVDKYIVPKVDFNSTNESKIISNLQNSPFANENCLMDLVKDGQVTKTQIEGYFKVKESYRQYISSRITFFDRPGIYTHLKNNLYKMIDREISNLSNETP